MLNAMTVDVEEHFQVQAFAGTVSRDSWDSLPSRVHDNTCRLLEVFSAAEVSATFFVLGWVAERQPDLVRTIASAGHEIGSHGFSHSLIYRQTPDEFFREAERSREILRQSSGQSVLGFRAASFSIRRDSLWAIDALAEIGYRYDSSIFPVYHDTYGIPGAPRDIHVVRGPAGGAVVEVPPSTLSLGRATLPAAGGGYLRILPGMVSRYAIRRLNDREKRPAVVYLHPWEVDPGQPRMRGPLASRLRHYTGLSSTEPKLRDLMSRFRFGTMRDVIEDAGFGSHLAVSGTGARRADRGAITS